MQGPNEFFDNSACFLRSGKPPSSAILLIDKFCVLTAVMDHCGKPQIDKEWSWHTCCVASYRTSPIIVSELTYFVFHDTQKQAQPLLFALPSEFGPQPPSCLVKMTAERLTSGVSLLLFFFYIRHQQTCLIYHCWHFGFGPALLFYSSNAIFKIVICMAEWQWLQFEPKQEIKVNKTFPPPEQRSSKHGGL